MAKNNFKLDARQKEGQLFYVLVASIFLLLGLVGCGGQEEKTDFGVKVTPAIETPVTGQRLLSIVPMAQQTPVWCWAASAEMVLRYYGLPLLNPSGNYQCGIVAAYYGPNSSCYSNCFTCISPIGAMSNLQLLINNYGVVANQFFPSRVLSSRLVFSALTFSQLAAEINSNRPVVAGISPQNYSYPNFSQHFVVIIGFDTAGGVSSLIVNDPFPYAAAMTPDPYIQAGARQLQAGRYSIPYTTFLNQMNWGNTIDRIQ
jgi:hypothetical protein